MDPRHLSTDAMDERLKGSGCAFCGGAPSTRDHIPSKVLLDKPYPAQLPIVDACAKCNQSFSLDEEYVACFLECVICGTTEIDNLTRPNVKRILERKDALKQRIEKCKTKDKGNFVWQPEIARFKNLILKLAKGHLAHELWPKTPCIHQLIIPPSIAPLEFLDDEQRSEFENFGNGNLAGWPGEIGSRAFLRAVGEPIDQFEHFGAWSIVQRGRYRYAVDADAGTVRIVLSEYLACEVVLESL